MTTHGPGRCLPLSRVLSLLGGLAIAAAYFMFWFAFSSRQGTAYFTGNLLTQILSTNPAVLRQIGMADDPGQVTALRALILLFPVSGLVVALLALVGLAPQVPRKLLNVVLVLAAAVPLFALAIGIPQLPPGARLEFGLWLIGGGALLAWLGVALDVMTARSPAGEGASSGTARSARA